MSRMVRLVAGAAALIAVFIGLGTLLAHLRWSGDAAVERELAGDRTHFWNTISAGVTRLAATPTVILGALAVALLLAAVLRRFTEPLVVALSVTGETVVFLAVTWIVHRHRPSVPRLDAAPPTSSFPSGHTAAAVALYGSTAVVLRRLVSSRLVRALALAAAVAVPLAVALSRLYRGMHFPTDVTGGALLGTLWVTLVVSTLLGPRLAPGASVSDNPDHDSAVLRRARFRRPA